MELLLSTKMQGTESPVVQLAQEVPGTHTLRQVELALEIIIIIIIITIIIIIITVTLR